MELSHSFADMHYVSIPLKRGLLLYKQPLESRSKTLSTYFACNTLTIVSARTRRIPHILGSKPAAHPLVLEICIEAFGEGVVLTRIADEAGVELEGLIEQRGQIVNQCIWQPTSPEEG
jgi:hypothetical protein